MVDNEICGKRGACARIAGVSRWVCARLGCAAKTISENPRRHADGAIFDAREARFNG